MLGPSLARFDRGAYVAAMEQLVQVVQELSHARSLREVTEVVRRAARDLTRADGATFVLRDGDRCYYAEENAISPLWKGMRFPMSACISGWVMLNATPAVIEDIYADPRIPADAYRPTFVKSLVMVPVRRKDPVAAIGNYWASTRCPSGEEIAILQALADTTAVALENAQLYGELQSQVDSLARSEIRVRAQRDALEVFTRALAHDLKEPVRTIRAFSEMLLDEAHTHDADSELLKHISDAGDRMGLLIETVFAYTQLDDPGAIAKERLCLDSVVTAAMRNLQHLIADRGATVTTEPLPTVSANCSQMTQVLQNLIANAISHSDRPVTIHVGVRELGQELQIFVRDDGPGIPAEFLQAIFAPFKRLVREDSHSGLGLAICKKVIELHGGRIFCESQMGQGATFAFTLPGMERLAVVAPAGPAPAAEMPLVGALAVVLLVDDRPSDILLTRRTLLGSRGFHCNCIVATDGREALAILQQALGEGTSVDLVLLDINMPGMDGFSMLERMGSDSRFCQIPVVMCSGSTFDGDVERARALGAVGYLVKPAQVPDLKSILAAVPRLKVCEVDGGRLSLVRTC